MLRTHPSGRFLDELVVDQSLLHAYVEGPAPLRRLVLKGTPGRTALLSLEDEPSPLANGYEHEVIDRFSWRLPELEALTLGSSVSLFLDGLSMPLEELAFEGYSRLFGVEVFLRRRRLPVLRVRDVPLPPMPVGGGPLKLVIESRIDARGLVAIGEGVRGTGVEVIDLSKSRIDPGAISQLAAMLQGSAKDLEVLLPPTVRRHARLKPILEARKRRRRERRG